MAHPMRIKTGLAMLALALGLAASGCAKDTYLVVDLTGSADLPPIKSFEVNLTVTSGDGDGGVLRATDVIPKKPDGAIKLPASMAFRLDGEAGTLQVDATALGLQDETVATASHTTNIMHSQTWHITLTLQAPLAASAAGP